MHGLRAKVENFSRDVQKFSSDLNRGVEDLKRSARAPPSVGTSTFRESLEELQQQADNAQSEIAELETATLDTTSLGELLGHCLAQLKENGKRVETLDAHLRKYGQLAAYELPKILENSESTKESFLVVPKFQPEQTSVVKDRKLRRSLSSPGLLDDGKSEIVAKHQLPLLTPSPVPSTALSMSSVSPGLRELQAKYGQGSGNNGSPNRSNGSPAVSPQRTSPRKHPKTPQRADMGSWITRKLDKSSLPSSPVAEHRKLTQDSRQSSRQNLNNENLDTGNLVQTAKLAAEDIRPPSTKLLTVQTQPKQPSLTGDTGSAHSYQGNNTPLGKDDIILVRLSNGEAPWDMLSLKAAINQAVPGTGDVQSVIESATFHPQAAAFTSLLHMCAKNKLWQKALEVFDGMKRFHSGVIPNTVHFSSLISACGTAGRWNEAMQVFEEMKEHAKKHPQCTPNVITYSALMTACCSGGRPDKAHSVFKDMIAQRIKPDHISYSTLIAGYERWGDMDTATKLFDEMRAAGLSQKALGPQSYLEQFSRKIRRSNSNLAESQEMGLKKLNASHRNWNSFASGHDPNSPCIGAHFPGGLPVRNKSNDGAPPTEGTPVHRSLVHERGGGSDDYGAILMAPGLTHPSQPVMLTPQRTPMSQMRSSISGPVQGLRGAGGSGRYRDLGRSPLSQSYDVGPSLVHAPGLAPPPGFISRNLVHTSSLDHSGSMTKDLQSQLGSADLSHVDYPHEPINQHLAHIPSVSSTVLDALVQQMPAQMIPGGAVMTPMISANPNAYIPSPLAPRASNGAAQISQVSVEEYNNLPLRFSRQLSLDQMNEAVDYINAVVEGKHKSKPRASSSGGADPEGVSPSELIPLQYGIQRTTALLNCLLQLKRMRLCVHDEQQLYVLLA